MVGGIIYQPKGRAFEYAPLAANLYTGCDHGCSYCYAPSALHKTREEFHSVVEPRKDVLTRLEDDCRKMKGDPRPVLLCFGCDPYPAGIDARITRTALAILGKYDMKASILTKGGIKAMRDFDLLAENGFSFGTSLSFATTDSAKKWEPRAAPVASRCWAIKEAKRLGIKTWVSVEPVVYPTEALLVIRTMRDFVDHWKIGKLNHDAELENAIDWGGFLEDVRAEFKDKEEGVDYYIKTDLLGYAR